MAGLGRRSSVLHVGGMRLNDQNRDPVERDWLLNSDKPITKRLHELTGISNSQKENSPLTWASVKSEVREFFSGLDVLIVFDSDRQGSLFTQYVFPHTEGTPVIVDALLMSQFFLPGKSPTQVEEGVHELVSRERRITGKGRLPNVIRGIVSLMQLLLETILSSSRSGIQWIYNLLSIAAEADLLKEFDDFIQVARIAKNSGEIRWEAGSLFSSMDDPVEASANELWGATGARNLVQDLVGESPHQDEEKDDEEVKNRTPIEFGSFLRTIERLPDKVLKLRSSQPRYIEFCARALHEEGIHAIEGGAGTGKTLGYLLTACESNRLNPDMQVVIASSTNNLMDQIANNDWARFIKRIPQYQSQRIARLKGKNNYLCLSAIGEGIYSRFGGEAEIGVRLAWLYFFLITKNNAGEWVDAPIRLNKRLSLWSIHNEVAADKVCFPGSCSLDEKCIYPQNLLTAQESDVVVTNHHKLALLPTELKADVCIIDEAEQFADNVRSATSTDMLSREDIGDYLRGIGQLRRPGEGGRRRGFLQRLLDRARRQQHSMPDEVANIDRAIKQIAEASAELSRLSAQLGKVSDVAGVLWSKLRSEQQKQIEKSVKAIVHHLRVISQGWTSIKNAQSSSSRAVWVPDNNRRAARQYAREKRSVGTYLQLANDFEKNGSELLEEMEEDSRSKVFSCHWTKSGYWVLRITPFDLTQKMTAIRGRYRHIIATSASLYVQGDIEFFRDDLGDIELRRTMRMKSPFTIDANVKGFLADTREVHPYAYRQDLREKNMNDVKRWIIMLSVAIYGRTLVLFTNRREMVQVYNAVAGILEANDIVPLLQDELGVSAAKSEMFRRTEHSVLFGLDRFWAGADFPGTTLSQVIAVRVPTPSPSWIINAHRYKLMGRAFWRKYAEPEACMKLRQGFGRLMRKSSDTGLFVMLDSRMAEHPYRYRAHVAELPVNLLPGRSVVGVAEECITFLKLNPEFYERRINLAELDRWLRDRYPNARRRRRR